MPLKLGYPSREALLADIDICRLHPRDRVVVRLQDGNDYAFHYMNYGDGVITGTSIPDRAQILIDVDELTLSEQGN